MIKIRRLDGSEAHTTQNGGWVSNNTLFEESLNIRASSKQVRDYSPCIERSMLELAKKEFKGLEVLECDLKNNYKYPKDAVF